MNTSNENLATNHLKGSDRVNKLTKRIIRVCHGCKAVFMDLVDTNVKNKITLLWFDINP